MASNVTRIKCVVQAQEYILTLLGTHVILRLLVCETNELWRGWFVCIGTELGRGKTSFEPSFDEKITVHARLKLSFMYINKC